MRALVTGGTGFVGSHLCRRLAEEGYEVHATSASSKPSPDPRVAVHPLEILDAGAVETLVGRIVPERIYHLAGQSSPRLWAQDPSRMMQVNVVGTVHVLDAVRRTGVAARVLVAGSSAQYGEAPASEMPLREDRPQTPVRAYGVSKVAADLLAYAAWRTDRIETVRARVFNANGPGGAWQVFSEFARRIAALEREGGGELAVGNLDARRDFSDVRDAARALFLAMEKGRPGEAYNVCTGRATRVGDVLDLLCKEARVPIAARKDPSLLRAADESVIVGDPGKLARDAGYAPRIPLAQTALDTLEYERTRTP